MDLRTYVATEIAEECVEGILTRREALRRLTLLGFAAGPAAALLAACSSDAPTAATTQASVTSPAATTAAPASSAATSAPAVATAATAAPPRPLRHRLHRPG